ncbi:UTRA domain-containing protein [Sphaerisporangium sp. NPDC051011]|uniref:UTRA domain-containing protein n=1 Tax=Sphaerisporangium sp. NPDC051011 TaxID=3155792 RepID=UPI0033DA1E39
MDPGAFIDAVTEGRGPTSTRTLVTARMPYAHERQRLQMEAGAPILLIRRLLCDKDDRPLEVTEVKASAEQFETTHAGENRHLIPEEVLDAMDEHTPPEQYVKGRVLLAL